MAVSESRSGAKREEAIGAAAADPRIRAVVAEGATTRMPADEQWLSDAYGAQGSLQEQMDRVTYGIADLLTPAEPPTPLRNADPGQWRDRVTTFLDEALTG